MTMPLFQALDEWELPEPRPEATRFKASWSTTLQELERELDAIRATNPVLRVVADPQAVRRDGMLRSDAKVRHRGVILECTHPDHGQLSYNCARFEARWLGQAPDWQYNVRAIVLTLGALRAVDRYGAVEGGQQYVGFKALGSGTQMGPVVETMTVDEAARFLAEHANLRVASTLIATPELVDDAYRQAARHLHPDAGGDPELFRRLVMARNLLANR